MVGHCRATGCKLGNHKEIVIIGHNILGNYSTCWHIFHTTTLRLEEPLVSFCVHHHNGHSWPILLVNFVQFAEQRRNHVLLMQGYLIIGATVGKDNDLFWGLFVSVDETID